MSSFRRLAACAAVVLLLCASSANADNVAQTLPFAQDWTNTGLITANDNWSGVPGVEGYLGQDITTATGTDPQTLLTTSAVAGDLTVLANQTATTITNGDVAEFQTTSQPGAPGTNPTIALQGSGTADAPYVQLYLNTTGVANVNVAYNLRDIDCTTDNATMPVALQFRVGNTGNFTNVPGGFVADATAGPSLCTLVTPVSVTLPAAAGNQPVVQIRIMTTNAIGNDEWVGVDDISVTSAVTTPMLSVNDVSLNEGNAGTTSFVFTVSLSAPAGAGGVTFDIATADGTATVAGGDYTANSQTAQTIPAGSSTYSFTVLVNGDVAPEPNESFFVNVTNVTGATVVDGQGQGTIVNDDSPPNLTINDVTLAEGNAGTTAFTFTVSLSRPADPGGVTFDIATADGTATVAGGDYAANSLTAQTILAGNSTYSFTVNVNGDTTFEPNETFFVNVTNVTGATVTDGQGQGTINNDDVAITRIHDVQGNGASSPIVGSSVTVQGIVTGRKSNGFFIQEPDATIDADPNTSEGILVFTSAAPPASAAVGALVQVTGTVAEFVPAADPLQPPLTELTGPTVTQLSTGNPLPTATSLTPTFPNPAGPVDQLERLEGMRVSVASATATSGTGGTVNEPNATSTNNGIFSAVVTGVARPFREPGIQANDPVPVGGVGTIPPIPRWDFDPELFQVDFDAIGGTLQALNTGAIVTNLVGPLDFGFRRYTLLPEPATVPGVAGGIVPTAVTAPTAREFTVASYNVERLFDTVDDPAIGEPVLTAAAFSRRLQKISLGVRNFMQTPDVVGFVEVENLTTLQAVATQINNDAVAAAQPNPQYVAFLQEGNDIGGIDVGFLVKTAPVFGATPRVTVNGVFQEKKNELFVNADASTELLNDRPSLRLDAVINNSAGATFPVTVIVNHLRSLNNSDDNTAGTNGWASVGQRVRAKRQKQAESLADIVQTRQAANPNERIILVGDFNAFEFNDGLVDMVDVIKGTPVPDNTTAVPGDGVDLVNPDLTLLLDTAAQRYSFLFGGIAQEIDHVLVNNALITATTARRVEHPRINADFAGSARGNATVERQADHDPLVSYYTVAGFATADLSITKTDAPDPVTAGTNLTYTVTVTNAGPDPAVTSAWTDTLPAGTTFVSLTSPAGWSCTTPAVGSGGTINCTNASVAIGSSAFTLVVAVAPSVTAGTVISNTANTTSTTGDPTPGNNSATATTTVAASADVSVICRTAR